jgi:DNA-binding IclR family transcriptional regulator
MAQTTLTGTRAVDRATSLLAYIISASNPPQLGALAREFDIPKSTTSRLVSAMERQGFVKRDRNGAFLPGDLLTQFAREQNQDSVLIARMRPTLESIAKASGETANLAIAGNGSLKIIDQVDGLFMLGVTNWIGRDVPYHCSALGKVLLAYGAATIPMGPLPKLTSKSITQRDKLLKELELVRKTGYAILNGELEDGLVAVAVPVVESDGRVIASMSISGPNNRLSLKDVQRIGTMIIEQVNEGITPPLHHNKNRKVGAA